MGAGRKTITHTFDSASKVPPQYRDLGEDLCGVIFGTTKDTINECIDGKLFGLPRSHYRYVKNINDGMPLFLFNYTDKLLHGIFEADGEGDADIDPNAWSSVNRNGYPAQVRVRWRRICKPLHESVFQKAIKDNYYSDRHFMFELDQTQVDSLYKLFGETPKSRERPWDAPPPSPPVLSNTTSYNPPKNAWGRPNSGSSTLQKPSLSVPPSSVPQQGLGKSTSVVDERLGSGAKPEHLTRKLKEMDLEGEEYTSNTNGWDLPSAPPSTGWSGLHGLYNTTNPPSQSSAPNGLNGWHKNGGHEHNLGTSNSSTHNFAAPVTSQAPLTVSGQTLTSHPGYQPLNIPSSSLQHSSVPFNGSGGNMYSRNMDFSDPSPTLHEVSSWEAQAQDQMQEEQARLRNDRRNLAEKMQGVDSQVAQSIQTNMEAYATVIYQMRQESMEVRRLKDEMKGYQLELEEMNKLVADNLLLQQRQAVTEQQIQSLLTIVGVMKPKFDEWVETEESESAEELQANEASEVNETVVETAVLEDENAKPEVQESDIYLMGGFKDDIWLDTVACFSPTTRQWKQVASMSRIRSCAAAAVLDAKLYIMGGGDGLTWYDSVEMYEKERDLWVQCAPLQKKRGSLAGAVCQGNIYALGGGDGSEMFNVVEYFSPAVNQWKWTAPMQTKRFCMAATEVNGSLVALGGYDGSAYLTSMERFDPREGIWSYTNPMRSRRGSLSVAILNEKLYAFGGFDGSEFLDSVEVYDPRADRWETAPSMVHRRAYAGAAVIGNDLYSMGGLSGQLHIEQIECYSESQGWREVTMGPETSFDASFVRSFLSVAVL